MKHSYKIFDSKNELAHAFARMILDLSNKQDTIHIALSGGSTPQSIFDTLAKHYADKIEWQKLRLFWVDERCVPPTHSESNYGMTLHHLLSKVAIAPHNVFRVKGELTPDSALAEYIKTIKENTPYRNGLPFFDITILGMGDDGHTASIFPHEIGLWNCDDICTIGHHPQSGQSRITLTGKTINHSQQIIFMVTGSAKAEKVWEIFTNSTNSANYPASLVDTKNSIWWLDKEASLRLS